VAEIETRLKALEADARDVTARKVNPACCQRARVRWGLTRPR